MQIETGRPHTAVVLRLSATDVKRSTQLASGAVCRRHLWTARVTTAKVWLHEVLDPLLSWLELWKVLFLVVTGVWLHEVLDPLAWLELWKVLFLVVTGVWLDEGVGSLGLAGAVEGLVSGGDRSLAA